MKLEERFAELFDSASEEQLMFPDDNDDYIELEGDDDFDYLNSDTDPYDDELNYGEVDTLNESKFKDIMFGKEDSHGDRDWGRTKRRVKAAAAEGKNPVDRFLRGAGKYISHDIFGGDLWDDMSETQDDYINGEGDYPYDPKYTAKSQRRHRVWELKDSFGPRAGNFPEPELIPVENKSEELEESMNNFENIYKESLREGGKRKNMSQETVDRFIHQLLLIPMETPALDKEKAEAGVNRRQEIVDEIFNKIKDKNTEQWYKNQKTTPALPGESEKAQS